MNAFLLSPEAAQDLIDIWEFIAGDNIDSADQVCEELQEAIQRIVEMPKKGHLRADLTDKPVRFSPVRSYLIIYRPDTTPLQIVRVLHGARDIESLL
ncbi:MAG: type II toxin-antitoxin system RelE/ParE family toxin [Acidobacteria bacterium]|nr:type II toxin-antitoxin system RelE/ParE family toxin [Acidobacteriota bacterium]